MKRDSTSIWIQFWSCMILAGVYDDSIITQFVFIAMAIVSLVAYLYREIIE